MLEKLIREFGDLHHELMLELGNITAKLKKREYSKEELCDIGFLCRELERSFDDWRKDCKARRELAEKVLAYSVMMESLDGEADDVVRGKLARAVCDVKKEAIIPKRGTDEFYSLMEHFGVTGEATEVLKFDWKRMAEFVTKLAEEGKEVPKGIDRTIPKYKATFTRLKNSKE